MLRIYRDWELRDYLRNLKGFRSFGIQLSRNDIALQWQGAYADEEGTIIYFIARKIDDTNEVLESYEIATDRIKFENGQYVYDITQCFDGYLPDGTYFFEFNDGYETYRSEIFTVQDMPSLMLASGTWLASSNAYITDINIDSPDLVLLKIFEVDNDYVQFEE